MQQLAVVLVVTQEILVAEVITRTILAGLTDTIVLTAASEQEALEQARTQPLALAILDLDLAERGAASKLYHTLRKQHPALPLLVCSTGNGVQVLDVTFDNRVVSLPELVAYPELLFSRVRESFNPSTPERGRSVADRREATPLRVLVLCQHLLARSALTHTLTRLGVVVRAAAEDVESLRSLAATSSDAQVIVGLMQDLELLQVAGCVLRLPTFVIATKPQELLERSAAQISGVSLMLFDESGDVLQLLAALRRVAEGQPFVAVSPAVLAAWTLPLKGLTQREWEVLIARVFTADRAAAARLSGLTVASVATYDKRVRRKIGPHSENELALLVTDHLVAQLGVTPEPLRSTI